MPQVTLKKRLFKRPAGATMKVSSAEHQVMIALGYVDKPETKAQLEARQKKAAADAAAAAKAAKDNKAKDDAERARAQRRTYETRVLRSEE